MSLAIVICATVNYQYALKEQARLIQANVADLDSGHLILVTDESTVAEYLNLYADLLGNTWTIHHIPLEVKESENYKELAQLTIARMRTAGFSRARALRVNQVWSLDSDVLPASNALNCMRHMLEFDGGYYGVSTCPYPSQGGGGFLFGRGTIYNQIAPDVYEDEREIPVELETELKEHRAKLPKNQKPSDEWLDEMRRLDEKVKQYPPKGNVFELNAKGWRKRGWGEMAYPAIGKGAIVPSDWCGFGCTLLGKQALALADFTGYEGKGTEDLFVCWNCWYPNGIKISALPHCLSHHVIRKKDKSGYTLCYAYHETEGECVGHIRMKQKPWIE
jgi:hypothetical protein